MVTIVDVIPSHNHNHVASVSKKNMIRRCNTYAADEHWDVLRLDVLTGTETETETYDYEEEIVYEKQQEWITEK